MRSIYSPIIGGLACLLAVVSANLVAADNKFEEDIKNFEAADKDNPPAKGGILFVGSSSIRMWDLKKYFPDQPALNRGFGGSQIADVVHFFDRVVLPYAPSVIVLYSGDNDIGSGKSPEQVAQDFQELKSLIDKNLPEAKFILIPAKPSLKRWNLWEKMSDANARNAAICAKSDNYSVINIATAMMGSDGKPKPELFLKDGLHLSDAGYEIWTRLVKAELESVTKH